MSQAKPAFIAVDWGTSSFRAALVSPTGQVLQELGSGRGILSFKPEEFVPYLLATCAPMLAAGGHLFLLSGMIGSKNGLLEVPYCPCPSQPEHIAQALGWVATAAQAPKIAIVPGVRLGFDDVMRGEETQVFGAAALLGLKDALMVLPGTHSKWVHMQGGAITGLSTYMTGEFYALLAQHSILAKSLPEASAAPAALDTQAFLQGLDRACSSHSAGIGLLGSAFSTRVKFLFNNLQPAQAASYLSGLIIGDELASRRLSAGSEVIVIGSPILCERYKLALQHLGVNVHLMGNNAAWAGLRSIYEKIDNP